MRAGVVRDLGDSRSAAGAGAIAREASSTAQADDGRACRRGEAPLQEGELALGRRTKVRVAVLLQEQLADPLAMQSMSASLHNTWVHLTNWL